MTTKLLVADDSPTIQKVIALTFADEDVEIEAVASGEEVIALARQTRPDIVLADVFMPGCSGYEVCASIKRDPELGRTPVVLLVGTFEPFDDAEAERVGCDGRVVKPFDGIELVDLVRKLVHNREQASAPEPSAVAAPPPEPRPAAAQPAVLSPSVIQPGPASNLVSARARDSFLGTERILDLFGDSPAEFAPGDRPAAVEPPLVPVAPVQEGAAAAQPETPAEGGEARNVPPPQVIPFPGARNSGTAGASVDLTDDVLNTIVERLVRRISPEVVREVAWEVVPELAEMIIRQALNDRGIPSRKS